MRASTKNGSGAPHAGSRHSYPKAHDIPHDGPDGKGLTARLGGRWHGSYGVAACPICQPECRRDQAALVIADGDTGRLLLSCKRAGCTFLDILAAAGIRPGAVMPPDPQARARLEEGRRADAQRKGRLARRLWAESVPIHGTLAEHYLRSRGITGSLPGTLRYLPSTLHGPSGQRFPAMLALVRGGPGFAIHRTFLRPDGMGKADVTTPRLALAGC